MWLEYDFSVGVASYTAMVKLCSFNCLRWALILLNIFYIVSKIIHECVPPFSSRQALGLILIGLVIATKTLTYISEPHILIGTAVCGSVLILLAIFGMIGAVRHNQVILFFVSIQYINRDLKIKGW